LHKARSVRTFADECRADSWLPDAVVHRQLPPDGATMKTILLMTAVLVLAGCGDRKGTTSGADTSAMGPATTDTAAMTTSDTAMTRDTAH
jgi:hypothetical protein